MLTTRDPAVDGATSVSRTSAYDALVRALLLLDRRVTMLWRDTAASRGAFEQEVRRQYTINCLRELGDLLARWLSPTDPSSNEDDWHAGPPRGPEVVCQFKLRVTAPDCTPDDIAAVTRLAWRTAHGSQAYYGCMLLAQHLR